MGEKNTVVIQNDAAAFLTPVLQGVEPVIRKSRKVGILRAVHTEHAAFFMYFCHAVPLPEKKIKRPPGAGNPPVRMSAFTHAAYHNTENANLQRAISTAFCAEKRE